MNEIRQFIIENVSAHPGDIVKLTMERFNISRQAVNRHLQWLVAADMLEASGNTRNKRYALKDTIALEQSLPITPDMDEDHVWRQFVGPVLSDLAENVLNICHFGFTEMCNNAKDHSQGTKLTIVVFRNPMRVKLLVVDNGVGIFTNIASRCQLEDERHAIFELSKGKLTTDPTRHSGEGIFFTSRVFEHFVIYSHSLQLVTIPAGRDYLVEESEQQFNGTCVFMEISIKTDRRLNDVFSQFTDLEDYGFTRTHIPVALARYGEDQLISRSQAKRVMARCEKFREVILDFTGVQMIGQAFADEIFRVYANQHPDVHISWVEANETVRRMIEHARHTNV